MGEFFGWLEAIRFLPGMATGKTRRSFIFHSWTSCLYVGKNVERASLHQADRLEQVCLKLVILKFSQVSKAKIPIVNHQMEAVQVVILILSSAALISTAPQVMFDGPTPPSAYRGTSGTVEPAAVTPAQGALGGSVATPVAAGAGGLAGCRCLFIIIVSR